MSDSGRGTIGDCDHGGKSWDCPQCVAQDTIAQQLAECQAKLAVAERKNAHSLANNLCPDHRDKQRDKPCLACSVETLERKLERLTAENLLFRTALENVKKHQEIVGGSMGKQGTTWNIADIALRTAALTPEVNRGE